VPHAELDTVGNADPPPGFRRIIVVRHGVVCARTERRRQRLSNALFEEIAGHAEHFGLDDVERLSFALANLDGEELQEMPVMVGRGGAFSVGMIEQPARDVEPDRSCTRRGAGRSIGRPHAGGVDE